MKAENFLWKTEKIIKVAFIKHIRLQEFSLQHSEDQAEEHAVPGE